jgi:hypothetical protein
MTAPTDHSKLLDRFRSWPWPDQSGDTLTDEECEAILTS